MLVSVIIPAYNREKYIKAAVESILRQTYTELEVIVVDDGSTDKTVDVVNSIVDPRVRLIVCGKNGGACTARNIGIEAASGELIAFQDSDDVWHADKLEKTVHALEEEQADFAFCAVYRKDKHTDHGAVRVIPSENLNEESDTLAALLYCNYVSTQTIVARRKVFEKIRFDSRFPRFQDWDLALQVAREGHKIYFVNEPLVDCEVLEDSITADGRKAMIAYRLILEKYAEEYEKYPKVYRRFCERAAFVVEMYGISGAEFFLLSYRSKKNFWTGIRYLLSKLHLYAPLNKCIEKLSKKKSSY